MPVLGRSPDLADRAGEGRSRLRPGEGAPAPRLPFRAVNRRDAPNYDPGLQRHHLLPRQLLVLPAFARLFASVPPTALGYDDFRRNGLLLPADPANARRLALPLHRGPHRHYNAVVIERVGGIEREWSRARLVSPERASREALFRIGLLQRALRRRLLTPVAGRPALCRNDPFCNPAKFAELDTMADLLWGATESQVASP